MAPTFVFKDALWWRHLEFRPIELAALGATSAAGFGASSGTIVGTSFPAPPHTDAGMFHAFIGSPTGAVPPTWKFASRDVPGAAGAAATSGRGINDHGDLVGWWRNAAEAIHPYVWLNGALAPVAFDVPGAVFPKDNTIHNAAFDINKAGMVVGQYAKSDKSVAAGYHHAGFVAPAPPAPAAFVEVDAHMLGAAKVALHGINNKGDVVGLYEDGNGTVSGLVSTDAKGGYAICQPVIVQGAKKTIVGGINDSRQIVGFYDVDTGTGMQQERGFIWSVDASGVPIGLPSPVDYPGTTTTGTRLDHIDNNGLMIGTTTNSDKSFMPFVCWYSYVNFLESLLGLAHLAIMQRVSGGVAAGGAGWAIPFLGWPYPVPPPLPYRESGQEAMRALALRELAGTLGDDETRKAIQKILHDYAIQQLRGIE